MRFKWRRHKFYWVLKVRSNSLFRNYPMSLCWLPCFFVFVNSKTWNVSGVTLKPIVKTFFFSIVHYYYNYFEIAHQLHLSIGNAKRLIAMKLATHGVFINIMFMTFSTYPYICTARQREIFLHSNVVTISQFYLHMYLCICVKKRCCIQKHPQNKNSCEKGKPKDFVSTWKHTIKPFWMLGKSIE